MIVDGKYIKDDAIHFIRHIKKLGEGYREDAYPKYSIFLGNIYIAVQDLRLIDLSNYHKIDDVIPDVAPFGYPGKSIMRYYINLKNVNLAYPEIEFERKTEFVLQFAYKSSLIIYNMKEYEKILSLFPSR
jgi:hypothetical protein